jgi:DNA end-binding protein Ku
MAKTKRSSTRWRSPAKRASARSKRSAKKPRAVAKKKTGARAIWKGVVSCASFTLPVKLYSAVQDKSIHFRLLDAKTKQPVKQHMVDADSGKVVEDDRVQRALQVSSKRMVVVEDQEVEKTEPRDSRDIDVGRFVAPEKISHEWFERPYWLGPDGDAKKYFALVEALRDENKEGFARWVMRKKDYAGALRVQGDHLMLVTMRRTNEVIAASELNPPGGREPDKREVEMAHKLVESMEGALDMKQFRDTYRDRVLELVKAKAAGKVLRFPRAKAKPTADKSLEAVLRKSLESAGKGRGKRRASA